MADTALSHNSHDAIVGFISVLAISASSLALLCVGKQFRQHCHSSLLEAQSLRFGEVQEEEEEGDEDEEEDVTAGHHHHVQRLERKLHRRVKKVRFAPDVVDPCSDGREYRQRFVRPSAPCSTEHRLHKHRPPSSSSLPPIPANRVALYNAARQHRRLFHDHALYSSSS